MLAVASTERTEHDQERAALQQCDIICRSIRLRKKMNAYSATAVQMERITETCDDPTMSETQTYVDKYTTKETNGCI